MSFRYPHLFSPIRIGKTDIILKNRLIQGPSTPPFIQGPENYPSEKMIQYYANIAKNGAALVNVHLVSSDGTPAKPTTENHVLSGHLMGMDIFDTKCDHYFSQLAEAVHFYNSRIIVRMSCSAPKGYDIANILSRYIPYNLTEQHMNKEMTKEMLYEAAAKTVKVCKKLKECGFDGVFLHASYRFSLIGRCLSKATNIRTDEFGGEDLENRCRFPFYLCDEIHKACGRNFIIEMSISGDDPTEEGRWTLEDTQRFMKLAEGHVDIVQMRHWEIEHAHPIGYEPNPRPFTYMAEAAKAAGSSVLVTTIGGNFDPQASEEIIKDNKADLIGMSRGWISNPNYGKLLLEGREEDIVPCIRCNKCLLAANDAVYASVCSVNPEFCIDNRLHYLIPPAGRKKKVAVIGGGPAGMEAAIKAHERGHEVVLYEQSDRLGGQLNTATVADFKWPLRNFEDYLIKKALNAGFEIRFNTKADPNSIKEEGYDTVIVAIGAKPLIPPIPGIERDNVVLMEDAYYHEEKIGNNVVFIGGGEVGVETAIYLCDHGKHVSVVEMQDILMPQASFEHYYALVAEQWETRENFDVYTKTKVIEIKEDGVLCETEGKQFLVPADTVVISSGFRSKTDEALEFGSCAPEYFYIGDCQRPRSLQAAMRDGYAIGSTI